MTSIPYFLFLACAMGMTTTLADSTPDGNRAKYEYTTKEVSAAAAKDLERVLSPYRRASALNRNTPEFIRAHRLFRRLVDVAVQRWDIARTFDWVFYMHEGPLWELYSRAGGAVVMSARFLEHYRPTDAELALVFGHEIAHVLCEHERMNLSAVWRRNAPYQLQARYAMEYLDTESMVRAQIAPIVRLQERIADRLGLELATETGVDPASALRFFDKSAADDSGGIYPDAHDLSTNRKSTLLHTASPHYVTAALFRSREVNCAP